MREWFDAVGRLLLGRETESASTDGTTESDAEGEEADGTDGDSGGDAPAVEYDPDEIEQRADVVTELGLEPDAFVVRLLDELGGRVPQQAFMEYTDWSEPTVSRVLQELEEEDDIVRVDVGREKLVCLPGDVPEGLASPFSDTQNSPS